MNVLRHPHLSLKIFILALLCCCTTFASAQEAVIVETIKLWDKGNHNAFTDLVRFKGRWFCAFREAEAHVSPQADIRILSSKNGRDWESASVIEMRGHDLRDPKLTISPDGKWLELLAGDTLREGNKPATLSHSFIDNSHDGVAWSRIHYVTH